ncbi:hypothetical protein DLAC_09297 [Tieghemostelium lacteum]|uniref:Bidirectional sugar transporter SWEET n=1 Tax=Tieghemostelium lacteum TaxID=361077 RepID=A0A151Z9R1_TIELA|nr:hypothetical protein DLAC_09297 [Tieghemostelium lacteum]|eukprot:KYQ90663.1 hypothetical protein DLAC_09297 [Tieghemostelium lacteum]
MSFHSVVVVILAILGNVLSMFLSLSPIKTFIAIDKNRDVGKLNIYPIIALCANSMGWVIYGAVTKRSTILPVNTFGMLATLYYIMAYYGAVPNYHQRRKIALIFVSLMTTVIVWCLCVILMTDDKESQIFLGFTTNVILFIFFLSPVFALYQVIKQRDTSTIYVPLAFFTLTSGLAWTFYGLLVNDPFIYVPNAFGAFLAVLQLIVYVAINLINGGKITPVSNLNASGNFIQVEEDESTRHLELDESETI